MLLLLLQFRLHSKAYQINFEWIISTQVVDLRENALKTILPEIIIHLNIFQLEVDLSSNSWIFNCRLNAFKHLIPFLSDSMRKKMSTSHSKSANNSQKPVLYLSSFHLNCSEGILFKTAAIPAGQTSVLRCDTDNTGGTWNRDCVHYLLLMSKCMQNDQRNLVWKVDF